MLIISTKYNAVKKQWHKVLEQMLLLVKRLNIDNEQVALQFKQFKSKDSVIICTDNNPRPDFPSENQIMSTRREFLCLFKSPLLCFSIILPDN